MGFLRYDVIQWLYHQAEACWTGLPVATTQGEQSYIKGNTKYMAIAVQVSYIHYYILDSLDVCKNTLFFYYSSDWAGGFLCWPGTKKRRDSTPKRARCNGSSDDFATV